MKTKLKKNIVLGTLSAALIVVLLSLTLPNKGMTPVEYVDWVNDSTNGLHQHLSTQHINYELQYKPVEYIVANEEKKTVLSQEVVEHRSGELDGLQYFNLRMAPKVKGHDILTVGNETEQDYFLKSDYYAYGFKDDIKLVEEGDTLTCRLFNMIQSYGVSPNVDFVIAFDKAGPINGDKTLVINDQVFGSGILEISIDEADLKQVPTLITH